MTQAIQDQTSPPATWFDVDGEGGRLSVCAQYVVIRQTYTVHRQIEEMLDQLRTATQAGGPLRWDTAPGRAVPPTIRTFGGGSQKGGFGGGGLGGGQQGGGGGFFHIAE